MVEFSGAGQGPPPCSGEVVRRLAELGLTWEQLWRVIAAGIRARHDTNRFAPLPAAGLRDWIARVETLRRQLAGEGWNLVNNHRIPLTVNPERSVGVGVLLGDESTGHPDPAQPRSKYPKGPQVLELAEGNDTLFSLADMGVDLMDAGDLDRVSTWMLVTHRFEVPGVLAGRDSEVRVHSELSLPGKPGSTHIDTWLKRIPLPPSSFPPPSEGLPDGDDVDGLTEEM